MCWLSLNYQPSLKWAAMKTPQNGCSTLHSKSEVLGITNHGIFHSIYFFDPNGHRLELAYDDEKAPQKIAMITEQMKYDMLEEWSKTKRAPQHTHFLHADELSHNSRTAKVDA